MGGLSPSVGLTLPTPVSGEPDFVRRYCAALLDNGRPRCTPKNGPFMQIARHTTDDPDG